MRKEMKNLFKKTKTKTEAFQVHEEEKPIIDLTTMSPDSLASKYTQLKTMENTIKKQIDELKVEMTTLLKKGEQDEFGNYRTTFVDPKTKKSINFKYEKRVTRTWDFESLAVFFDELGLDPDDFILVKDFVLDEKAVEKAIEDAIFEREDLAPFVNEGAVTYAIKIEKGTK